MYSFKCGIAVVTYNRDKHLAEVLDGVMKTRPGHAKLVLVDDGSTDGTFEVAKKFDQFLYIKGANRGVIANKNRALFALQDCDFLAIIEDDLIATSPDWFSKYVEASLQSGIQHFCRVQDKEIPESEPSFTDFMKTCSLTPIYGPSPRGDLTFITSKVIKTVGAFNPQFLGAGYGHGEWSERVCKSGLVPHPLKWVDIKEARDSFIQKGDTTGGRWGLDPHELKEQLKANKRIQKQLKKKPYIHHPLVLY